MTKKRGDHDKPLAIFYISHGESAYSFK